MITQYLFYILEDFFKLLSYLVTICYPMSPILLHVVFAQVFCPVKLMSLMGEKHFSLAGITHLKTAFNKVGN